MVFYCKVQKHVQRKLKLATKIVTSGKIMQVDVGLIVK